MQYLFALLVLVAVMVCVMAQFPYLGALPAPFYRAPRAFGYPYAAHGAIGAYGYPGVYNYGAFNPAYPYLWKK